MDDKLTKRLVDYLRLRFEIRESMRYDDVGDYFDNTIVVYDMKNNVINNAIFLHEFIEFTLIKSAGIDPELIDRFDTDPKSRDEFPNEHQLYREFHDLANQIERQFIENLGFDWEEHQHVINTTPIKVAVQQITDRLHDKELDKKELKESKQIIENTFDENR